jgi:hypothetical protein
MNGSTVPLCVADSSMVLLIDPNLEHARARAGFPLVLTHGKGWESYPCPFSYASFDTHPDTTRCYDAAMETAERYPLRYVEGFLLCWVEGPDTPYIQPLAHAWCVDSASYVVDSVLHKNQNHPSLRYVGLPIKKEYSRDWHRRVGYYGCLDGDVKGRRIGPYYEDPSLWLDL